MEAVILFARKKQLDPGKVLEDAYPFLRNMIEGGFLVQSDHALDQQEGAPIPGQVRIGTRVMGAAVLRTLHVLEDTEVYLLSKGDEFLSVLKIERLSPHAGSPGPVRARLSHEAAFLAHLDGSLTPKLLGQGELDGRSYLEMEFIQGVDLATASAEWRERKGEESQRKLLGMAQTISRTYAALHDRGVLHGDVHPSNIVVGRDSSVRLIDFGVARATTPGTSLPTPPHRAGIPFFSSRKWRALSRGLAFTSCLSSWRTTRSCCFDLLADDREPLAKFSSRPRGNAQGHCHTGTFEL